MTVNGDTCLALSGTGTVSGALSLTEYLAGNHTLGLVLVIGGAVFLVLAIVLYLSELRRQQ